MKFSARYFVKGWKTMHSIVKMMTSDMDLWRYWGFEPWSMGNLSGVRRKIAFVKPALIGEVARYYAIDTIVWAPTSERDREKLWTSIRPAEDVMTQRFMFLLDQEASLFRIKSFLLGFRGYKEFHSYWPGRKWNRRLKDLAPLVDKAIALSGRADVQKEVVCKKKA